MPHARRFTIRQHLMAFGVTLLAPGLIFAAFLLWNFANSERSRLEQEAQDAAHRIVAAVDRELTAILAAAQALATASSLDEGNYEAFQGQALATLQSWSPQGTSAFAVVVRDVTGQQVSNTRLPWGAVLPKGANLPVDHMVIETRKPVIQDLFVGATAGRPIISVRVPVFRGNEVTHILSMAVEPRRFAEVLQAQSLPRSWIGTVIDRADRVVARSQRHEAHLGTMAPEEFRRSASGSEGIWEGHNLEGEAVLGGYARSGFSGWRAFVGVPSSIIQRPLHQSLLVFAALGILLLGLSFLMALWFGQRIARPVHAVAADAERLGRGSLIKVAQTSITEIDAVSQALATASSELHAREVELRSSEARLRATHENAAVGIVEVDRDGRFIAVNEMRCKLTGHTREELLGRHFGDATYGPDLGSDVELFARQVAGELDAYTVENRFHRKDGTDGWVRVSSTAVRSSSGEFLYAVRIVEDVSERKQAEFRQMLLVDELNHRVKNTLATVQSLAWQSSRPGVPPDIAQARFQARLFALSRTHNLLNQTSWERASVSKILQTELEPYNTSGNRVRLTGPTVDLAPAASVVLGMAVHELATNAAKHGSLSVIDGRLTVDWRREPSGEQELLCIEWCELDGPPVQPPSNFGFGSRLIRQIVEHELAGTLDLAYSADGVCCKITFPIIEPVRTAASTPLSALGQALPFPALR